MNFRSNLAEIPAFLAVFGGPALLVYILFWGFGS